MNKICVIPGCKAPHAARGWCDTHWARWKRHGDPLYSREITKKPCIVDGCSNESVGRGLCTKHWTRWRRYGDPHRIKTHSEYVKVGPENHAFKHGCEKHPLYYTWSAMMERCYNKKNPSFVRYGGRGITVCERWNDVRNFIADMNPRPSGLTLERKDNSLGYSPENCEWATRKSQSRNRRTTKLSSEKAEEIREMRKAGMSKPQIAVKMGVGVSNIKKVIANKIWAPQ